MYSALIALSLFLVPALNAENVSAKQELTDGLKAAEAYNWARGQYPLPFRRASPFSLGCKREGPCEDWVHALHHGATEHCGAEPPIPINCSKSDHPERSLRPDVVVHCQGRLRQ